LPEILGYISKSILTTVVLLLLLPVSVFIIDITIIKNDFFPYRNSYLKLEELYTLNAQ